MLVERGMLAMAGGNPAAALRAYAEVLAEPDADPRQYSIAAFNRALLLHDLGDDDGALAHWNLITDATSMREPPLWIRCSAWMARGKYRNKVGDHAGAVCDFTAVIGYAGILATHEAAVADAKVFIAAEASPRQLVCQAYVRRGGARHSLGDIEGAVGDLLHATQIPGAAPSTVAAAYGDLAECLLLEGRPDEAISAAQEAMALWPMLKIANLVVAVAVMMKGDFPAAMDAWTRALVWITEIPDMDRVADFLADVERRHGAMQGLPALRVSLLAARSELEARRRRISQAEKLRRLHLGER